MRVFMITCPIVWVGLFGTMGIGYLLEWSAQDFGVCLAIWTPFIGKAHYKARQVSIRSGDAEN